MEGFFKGACRHVSLNMLLTKYPIVGEIQTYIDISYINIDKVCIKFGELLPQRAQMFSF